MFKKEDNGIKELTEEELHDILTGARELSKEELTFVVGGEGDDRENFTMDQAEIEKDIFGTKF